MKNKVLIKIIIPELDKSYDVFIPVNELVWKVKQLLIKSIFDLSGLNLFPQNLNYLLVNKNTGKVYTNNQVIINTDIRNSTELILLPVHF